MVGIEADVQTLVERLASKNFRRFRIDVFHFVEVGIVGFDGELRRKVFGIGLNKTGTSSLKLAMEHLGYRTSGSNKALLREVRR